MRHAGKEPFPSIFVDSKDEKSESQYEPIAKTQLKKIQKLWAREANKTAEKSKKEGEDAQKREQNMEEARKIKITQDPTWALAKQVRIDQGAANRAIRVKINGWVHRLRRQGKGNFVLAKERNCY